MPKDVVYICLLACPSVCELESVTKYRYASLNGRDKF
jgi:hypothetical protein